MLFSAAFFLLCPWHNLFVLLTLLFINISMPCTLYLATKTTLGREGWTFGLLAMALLPGFFLGQLLVGNTLCQMLLEPLMATILLETVMLLLMHEYRWQVLAASTVFNICTNMPLNFAVMTLALTSPLQLILLEGTVVVVEFFGYWLVLRDRRCAFKYSLLCNVFSFLVGLLCQHCVGLLAH